MKLCIFLLTVACFISYADTLKAENISSAITYELNGGRFGDNLLSYSRAKWLSYKYGIPVQVYPFPYSDQLLLSQKEQKLCIDNFKHVVRLSRPDSEIKKDSNTLYINHWRTKVDINWNDRTFVSQLKEMIAPAHDIQKVSIPQGYISVAVHVRNGGGAAVDNAQEKERCPLRFVPDEFFIAQIERIARMFEGQKLYVYIFTDHKKPKKLMKKFSEALNDENIVFDCQQGENGHKLNVLEDFFSMMEFNCLIRPGSHFSRFVERLGEAQVIIYPESVQQKAGEAPIINVIGIKTRLANGKLKTEKMRIVE